MSRSYLNEIFNNRNYDEQFFSNRNKFLYLHNPVNMSFCNHLEKCRKTKSKIVHLCDFDTDGIMSGVIGFSALSRLGFNVSLYPLQPRDGYGFTEKTIDDVLKKYPNTKYILTSDVGIGSIDAINYGKETGLIFLVTDHHKPVAHDGNIILPQADVIINPMLENLEFKGFCGAYVLWHALFYYVCSVDFTDKQRDDIKKLWFFSAIGTISDLMPLYFDNNFMVKNLLNYANSSHQLENNDYYDQAFIALDKLFNLFPSKRVNGKITETYFAFYIIPMLNSVKRLEKDIIDVFSFFFVKSDATKLLQYNDERKRMVDNYYRKILKQDNKFAPYLYQSDAPSGLLGLLAMKFMVKDNVPVVVVNDQNKGSGRIPDFYQPFDETWQQIDGLTLMGHNHAFGAYLVDQEKWLDFVNYLDTSSDVIKNMDNFYDLELSLQEIEMVDVVTYMDDKDIHSPFGSGFKSPKILLKLGNNVEYSVIKDKHILVKDKLDIWIFNTTELPNYVLGDFNYFGDNITFSGGCYDEN